MDIGDRYATRANSPEETPEPFRIALLEHLSARESIEYLAFSPANISIGVRSPATLLALTDRRWLVVSDDADGRAAVAGCAFDDTLLVELTEILLHCQLKIDYVAGVTAQSCAIEFAAMSDSVYREAVRLLLRGMGGRSAASAIGGPAAVPEIGTRPIIFRNTVPEILAEGGHPIAGVQWSRVYGSYGGELVPAAALLTTDRELVLFLEKKMRIHWLRLASFGYIATFFPLARLVGFGFRHHERFSILDLEMHASHGGERFEIVFPREQGQAVEQVVECARRQAFAAISGKAGT
jgi:hypothetical protein